MIEQKAMIEHVIINEKERAIIVKAEYETEGVSFLTPDEYSQQIAIMHHPTGKMIDAHAHTICDRMINDTQEVLVIRDGILRVDFYDADDCYQESRILQKGDVILLVEGSHGFKVLQEVDMIEIKQGPYLGENDKRRFEGVCDEDLRIV